MSVIMEFLPAKSYPGETQTTLGKSLHTQFAICDFETKRDEDNIRTTWNL